MGSTAATKPIQLPSETPQILKQISESLTSESNKQFTVTRKNSKSAFSKGEIVKIYGASKELVFEGNLVGAKLEGTGILYGNGKTVIYEGELRDNAFHGWGITSLYRGEFKRGKRDGWGVYESSNLRYEGMWREDYFHGMGALNVSLLEADKFMQIKQVGIEDKIQYVGEWSMGVFSRCGKLTSKNLCYTGQFLQGIYHGQGELVTPQQISNGKFVKGEFNG